MHLKLLGKQELVNSKTNRKKQIMKGTAEINEPETKIYKELMKQKAK